MSICKLASESTAAVGVTGSCSAAPVIRANSCGMRNSLLVAGCGVWGLVVDHGASRLVGWSETRPAGAIQQA